MIVDILFFILGFAFLLKGADILVDGSSAIARRYGVSSFFIGMTVVAFGTSAPEMVVSVMASVRGSAGVALGNVIGSNFANTLLILGVAALIAPLAIKKTTINKEIPYLLLAIAAVAILANDFLIDRNSPNSLTRIDGLILMLFFGIFIFYTFGISREKENIFEKTIGDLKEEPKQYSLLMASSMSALGLAGLVLGGRWIVNSAIDFATFFGISEAFIALTVVAIGTSLPELAASAIAAKKGHTDIAVGNVVGSNIFNLLWVLGLAATVAPIKFDTALNVDIGLLFAVTILLLFLIYIGKRNILGKGEGITLLAIYLAYLIFLVIRG